MTHLYGARFLSWLVTHTASRESACLQTLRSLVERQGDLDEGDRYMYTYTMVVKFDHAIGGFLNLLENPIDKISTQTCFLCFSCCFHVQS